jgi:cytochrome P450 family 109
MWYPQMDRSQPVAYSEASNCWLFLDYDIAQMALNDDTSFSSRPYASLDSVLLGSDCPDHKINRTVIERFYSKHRNWGFSHLSLTASSVASRLISRLSNLDSFDLAYEFIIPYSVYLGFHLSGLDSVNSEWDVLNCDEDDLDETIRNCNAVYRDWSLANETLNKYCSLHGNLNFKPQFRPLTDDLVHISEEQWFHFIRTMLIASSETPSALISNAIQVLLELPDIVNRLDQDSSLIRTFLYEVLRFYSPAQLTLRTVVKDMELANYKLSTGDLVAIMIGFIHRDPTRYPHPDIFDLHRPREPLLAFGEGPHECIGKHVAFVLGQQAILSIMGLLQQKYIASLKFSSSPQVHSIISLAIKSR